MCNIEFNMNVVNIANMFLDNYNDSHICIQYTNIIVVIVLCMCVCMHDWRAGATQPSRITGTIFLYLYLSALSVRPRVLIEVLYKQHLWAYVKSQKKYDVNFTYMYTSKIHQLYEFTDSFVRQEPQLKAVAS